MRLARYNIQLKDLKHFAGLPIPGGAGFLAATVHLFVEPFDSPLFTFYLVAVVYLLSFLMISAIRYPSLSQLNLGRGKSHLNVLLIALLVAGVAWYSQEVLMVLATLYVSTGLFSRAQQFVKYRLHSEELAPKESHGQE